VIAFTDNYPEVSNKAYREALTSSTGECLVKGIVFQGCPFEGSTHADLVSLVTSLASRTNPFVTVSGLVRSIQTKDKDFELNSILGAFKTLQVDQEIDLIVTYEKRPTFVGTLVGNIR
jgi:hypothetical protein